MSETEPPADVAATFTLEYRDLAKAQWWSIVRLRPLQILYGMMLFALLTFALPAASEGRAEAVDPSFIGVLVGFFIVLPLFLWWQVRRSYQALKPEQLARTYTFSARGFTVADGLSSAQIAWAAVPRAVETQDAFLVFVHKQIFHTIPKRAFRGAEDLGRLRETLVQALGPKARVRPPSAAA